MYGYVVVSDMERIKVKKWGLFSSGGDSQFWIGWSGNTSPRMWYLNKDLEKMREWWAKWLCGRRAFSHIVECYSMAEIEAYASPSQKCVYRLQVT